jgi:hypothetical protein
MANVSGRGEMDRDEEGCPRYVWHMGISRSSPPLFYSDLPLKDAEVLLPSGLLYIYNTDCSRITGAFLRRK